MDNHVYSGEDKKRNDNNEEPHCRLNQNLALKSSEQERKAAWVGECTSQRTGPLCPSDRSCFLLAFLASQAQREVVASSGNMTKSSLWLKTA